MGEDNKRKGGPGASHRGGPSKKSKGGGKWQTSSQKAKIAEKVEIGTALAVGDEGIWVTYARGMGGKSIREFRELCYEYGETMYGIKHPDEDKAQDGDEDEDEEQDIAASIEQELQAMKPKKPETRQVFSFVQVNIECVFFVKTMAPVEPKELVRKICQDARECASPLQRKLKYINRLTPVTDTDKATDNGIAKVARSVLGAQFNLKAEAVKSEGADAAATATESAVESEATMDIPTCTYAIRTSLRSHTNFKTMEVINKIAAIVQPTHKVDLTNPDKVVLVEIFQLFCGISVVDGKEWESMKRYNVNELYRQAFGDDKSKSVPEAENAKVTEGTAIENISAQESTKVDS